ncbi:MAG: alpha/beta fold hydrolase [Planctomycetota bacterium]
MQHPTLVFIHGFMGHPSDWDELRDGLSELDSVALEVPVTDHWDETVGLLEDAIPDNSILVGYSMGARLALATALNCQKKLAGLVFVSGNPGLESQSERSNRWLSDQQTAARIRNEDLEEFLRNWYEQGVFSATALEIREEEIKRKLSRDTGSWPSVLLANSVSRQPNLWTRVSALSIPVLAVAGEADEKYTKIAIRLVDELRSSQSRAVIIPDCGHIVHREQQDLLVRGIREFVATIG